MGIQAVHDQQHHAPALQSGQQAPVPQRGVLHGRAGRAFDTMAGAGQHQAVRRIVGADLHQVERQGFALGPDTRGRVGHHPGARSGRGLKQAGTGLGVVGCEGFVRGAHGRCR